MYDDDFGQRPKRSLDESFTSGLELDLELDDIFDDEESGRYQLAINFNQEELDIFQEDNEMEQDDDCCKKNRSINEDYAQESTIISNLPEPEYSYDTAPFDYSVDMFLDTSQVKPMTNLNNQSVIPRPLHRGITFSSESMDQKGCIPDKDGNDEMTRV